MSDTIGEKNLRDFWDDLARESNGEETLFFLDSKNITVSYSYPQFNLKINQAANLLIGLGVKKGDRVSVHLSNCAEAIICLFALAKIGAIMVPINTHYSERECLYAFEKCTVSVAIFQKEFQHIYNGKKAYSFKHKLVARTDETISDALCFTREMSKQPTELQEVRPISSEDPVEILFTSGTTSMPKGVVITHCNLLFSGVYTAWQLSMRKDDRYLNMMPSFHVDFQLCTLMPVLTAGATLILLEKYSARSFWKTVCTLRATITECIPMMIRTLLAQPISEGEENHSLREVFFYMNITPEEKTLFETRFHIRLFNSYGLTESLVGAIGDCPFGERRWPSIGRPGLTYEAKIADKDGKELPPNTIGEICIKGVPGRTLMKEYYKDPEATERTLSADGWLRTGDKGYIDESGWYFFFDRKENMIKRCGENISTTEIEEVLMAHPKIAEAAVIGVPDPVRDQAVKAFVVLGNGEQLTIDEILVYCEETLAKFKIPSFIEMWKSLPKNGTFKVRKKMLK